MEKRYERFAESKVIDLVEYNKNHRKLPRYVILIDEYADLMMEKKENERLVQAIQRIGQKGRAAGIHLVLSTQRPDSKVITPLIKANLQLKIALKVTSAKNSMIILDETGAECLLGKGDLLMGGSLSVQRLQGAMVRKVKFK
jgi:S-DNA-T family DNA segregation ATPase FtsK/SpoIIIE